MAGALDLTQFYDDTLKGVTRQIPGALAKMQSGSREALDMQRRALDDYRAALGRSDGVDVPMLMASAAIGQPTRGGLGGALASGMEAYGGALMQQRQADMSKAEKLARIAEGLANLHKTGAGLGWDGVTQQLQAATSVGGIDNLAANARALRDYRQTFGGGDLPALTPGALGDVAAEPGGMAARAAPAATPGAVGQSGVQAGAQQPQQPTPQPPQSAPQQAAQQGAGEPRLSAEAMARYQRNQQIIARARAYPGSREWGAAASQAAEENKRLVPDGVFVKPDGALDTTALRVAADAKRRSEGLSSGDRTAVRGLEDEMRGLDNTLTTLQEAAQLAPKAYSGFFATTRGRLGENLPDWAVPDAIADPKTAEATMRLNQILSAEAVKAMSQTLKGASTDKEMQKFLEIVADPAAPPQRKLQAIEGIARYARRQREDAQITIDQIRGGDYYKPGGGLSGRPAPNAAPTAAPPVDPVEAEMRRRGLTP